MKITLLFLCVLLGFTTSAQEVFRNKTTGNKTLFLGGYKDGPMLKVYESGKIHFVEQQNLEQIDELKPVDFLQFLSQHNLQFHFEGFEPSWDLSFNGNTLTFYYKNIATTTTIEFFPDTQSGCNIMFKSNDAMIFGLIIRTNYHFEKDHTCNLSPTDDFNTFEIYATINGEMFKGCGSVTHME